MTKEIQWSKAIQQKNGFYGHTQRQRKDKRVRIALGEYKRSTGKSSRAPKCMWSKYLDQDLAHIDISRESAQTTTKNRLKWCYTVAQACNDQVPRM